ncbi:hypothetical protein ACSBM8_00645 [Sphingomonas sp. ASY06-1R]|jgi:hypothetical protein|uniref:hypothetical protein n=1 Tax=unclassified Sphingomonas TaxID=196159 RepID=UPI003B3B1C4E
MSLLIKDSERGQAEWNRKARDSINAVARRMLGSGPSANRPPKPVVGQMYYDTTLGKPIWRHASGVWRDAGGTVV